MAKINKVLVGESLVGDGNEVAHIDIIMGPRGSAAESAFTHALTNNKDGFTSLLAVIGPNLATKPHTVLEPNFYYRKTAGWIVFPWSALPPVAV